MHDIPINRSNEVEIRGGKQSTSSLLVSSHVCHVRKELRTQNVHVIVMTITNDSRNTAIRAAHQ